MKKVNVALWSIITYVAVCLLELLICNSSTIPLWSMGYTLTEKVLFYVIGVSSGVLVAFILRTENAKHLFINSVIMWCIFVVSARVIGVRYWIGILTNNETIVFGVNFLGDDVWISHYIGCFVGMVADIIIILFRKVKNRGCKNGN